MKSITALFIGRGKNSTSSSSSSRKHQYQLIRNDLSVMHISGSPGTGKTTLGIKLEKDFFPYVRVIDTDSFISDEEGEDLLSRYGDDEDVYKAHWSQLYKDKFYASYTSIAMHDRSVNLIIYTGILFHWAYDGIPITLPYAEYMERFPRSTLNPPFLIFYMIPLSQLLLQFYSRELKMIHANRKVFDEEVIMKRSDSDHAYLSTSLDLLYFPSLGEYLTTHRDMINWHVDRGYEIGGVEKILRVIKYYLRSVLQQQQQRG